jgi:peptide/nickel transport system permease protein
VRQPAKRLFSRRRNWPALFGLLAVLLIMAFGGVVAPFDPIRPDYSSRLQAPSARHWMGTDELGRDVFSRVLVGTRISLGAALTVEAVVVTVGMLVGLLAGYVGGAVDEVVMRITDVFMAFPGLLLAIAVVAVLGPSLNNAVLAVSFTWWPIYARLTRGQVLGAKENLYVLAAKSIGASEWRVMTRHVLLNCITPIIVQLTIAIGAALVVIAGLSFLGLGASPPAPEWGALIYSGFRYILVAPWYSTVPGVAIVLAVMVFTAVGGALQESFR